MIKSILKPCWETVVAAFFSFALLESLCFIFGVAPGMEDFIQTIVMKNHLALHKPKHEIRIFTYGESTMHGAHYAPHSSPTQWMKAYLKDFLPDKNIRIFNFARMGRGIDYTEHVFKRTLIYKPDIAIFYNGHNDFLPDNRVDKVKVIKNLTHRRWIDFLSKSRLVSLIYRQLVRHKMARKEARPDQMGHEIIETPASNHVAGTYATLRSEPVYFENVQFFKGKVENILELGKKKKVHLLFFNPVSNLKDFPPVESEHMKSLSAERLAEWESHFQQGEKSEKSGDSDQAFESYRKAHAIDNTYADLSYRIARIYFSKAQYKEAKVYFEEAKDNDTKKSRAPKDIQNVLFDLKSTRGLFLVDTEKALGEEVLNGILGFPVIEDNVHFSVRGQYRLGLQLALEMAERNWIAPKVEWKFESERTYEEISKELKIDNDLQVSAFIKVAGYFGDRFKERILFAKKAVELDPKNSYALRALAWAYWISGDPENAAAIYGRLKRIDVKSYQDVIQRNPDLKKLSVSDLPDTLSLDVA